MSAELPDFYAILHVDPGAPAEIIRASYRTLMQQLRAHPDLGGDHELAALLNAAYSTLRDPQRRAAYDVQRSAGLQVQEPGEASSDATTADATSTTATPEQSEDRTKSSKVSGEQIYAASAPWLRATRPLRLVDACRFCGEPAPEPRSLAPESVTCRRCSAPLTLPERGGATDPAETQRSIYRIAKAEALRIFDSPADRSGMPALVHDISLIGMRFSCRYELTPGAVIRGDCEICGAVARVAHCAEQLDGTRQYGAQFLTVRFKRQRGSLLSVPV